MCCCAAFLPHSCSSVFAQWKDPFTLCRFESIIEFVRLRYSTVKLSLAKLFLKNLVWDSHNSFLSYITVEENFIISTTFIFFYLHFVSFAVEWIIYFCLHRLNFFSLFPTFLPNGCINLISANKRTILYPR